MSKIKEILEKKGPHFNTVEPSTPVIDALTIMQSENLSYVVVMENNHFLGIMSERDYTHKIKLKGRHSDSTIVKEIMTHDLPVIGLEVELERCMVLMNVYKTRYLPVFDNLEFKGVITMNDLMRDVLDKKEL
jgi:CBS domain-containing protein